MLMPPQNPTLPSITASLRCRRRKRVRLNLNNESSGRNTSECTPASSNRGCRICANWREPNPWPHQQTVHPRLEGRIKYRENLSPEYSSPNHEHSRCCSRCPPSNRLSRVGTYCYQ